MVEMAGLLEEWTVSQMKLATDLPCVYHIHIPINDYLNMIVTG